MLDGVAPQVLTAYGPGRLLYFEAQLDGHYFAVYASRRRLPERPARLATGWRLPLAGRDFHPLGSVEKFQVVNSSILLSQA